MENVEQTIDISASDRSLFKKYAKPMMMSLVLMSIISMGDRIIGTIWIGTDALQVVSLGYPIMAVAIAAGLMIYSGLGVEMNYLIGQGRQKDANRLAMTTLLVQFVATIAIALTMVALVDPIARFLLSNGEARLLGDLKDYVKIVAFAIPLITTGLTLSTIVVSEGSSLYNMGGLIIFSLGNLILNIIFVAVLDMGVFGLALGTFIAGGIIYTLYYFMYFMLRLHKSFKIQGIEFTKRLGLVFYNGSSEFISNGALAIMMVALNIIIQDNLTESYFIAYSLVMMFVQLYNSVGDGAIFGVSPVISKMLGSGEEKRIPKFSKYTIIRTTMYTVGIYILLLPLVRIISDLLIKAPEGVPVEIFNVFQDEILDHVVELNLILGFILLFNMYTNYFAGQLSAIKRPLASLILTLSKIGLMVPIFTTIFVQEWGKDGIIFGNLLAQIISIPMVYFVVKWSYNNMRDYKKQA